MKRNRIYIPFAFLLMAMLACNLSTGPGNKTSAGETISTPTFTAQPVSLEKTPSPTAKIIVNASTATQTAEAVDKTKSTTEQWVGTWTNSLGESGSDTLEITYDEAGNITGLWAGTIDITGVWTSKNAFTFTAHTDQRDYQVTGNLEGDTLTLHYIATRLDSSGTYTGDETLTRVTP